MSVTEAPTYTEALAWVNSYRAEHGLEPLAALPEDTDGTDKVLRSQTCPIARATNGLLEIGVTFAYSSNLDDEKVVFLPAEVGEFITWVDVKRDEHNA